MSSRAQQFGNRMEVVVGGSSKPIFIVTTTVSGADSSRGVRGTAVVDDVEIIPRPLMRIVSDYAINTQGSVLQQGDVEIDITDSRVYEGLLKVGSLAAALMDPRTQFRVGNVRGVNQLFNIVNYTKAEYLGDIVYWRVFCRGVVGF